MIKDSWQNDFMARRFSFFNSTRGVLCLIIKIVLPLNSLAIKSCARGVLCLIKESWQDDLMARLFFKKSCARGVLCLISTF